MANIEGEARHVVDTNKAEGQGLLMSPGDGNVIVHALQSSSQSAMLALQNAVAENDLPAVASAMAAGREASVTLSRIMKAGDTEDNETGSFHAGPVDLGVMVNSLVAYKHKLDGALADVKAGQFVPVDKAREEKLEDNEIYLEDYNALKADLEQALPIAERVARYLREQAPDILKNSLDFFVMQGSQHRDTWMAKDSGLPVGSVWDGMLSTASVLFGYEPDILDGMVQAKNAGRYN